MEYLPGCPLCEHNDSELERELQALAQFLLDMYVAKQNTEESLEPNERLDIPS